MTRREDVEFLEVCNPALIAQNGEEFCRMHRLISSVDGGMFEASGSGWDSKAADAYGKRLDEAHDLLTGLSSAYKTGWQALVAYADGVTAAKRRYEDGQHTERLLSQTIARVAEAKSPTAREAEPLRRWEDLRKSTGILDAVADFTVDVDSIREEAESYYAQTRAAYGDAERIERDARTVCVAELLQARKSLPVFHGPTPDPATLLAGMPAFGAEAAQAQQDPNVQLPGTGPKSDTALGQPYTDKVSPKLASIRARIDALGLPPAKDQNKWLPSDSDQRRREWIEANRGYLLDAAASTGIPADVLAGVAWQEVEGDPKIVDDIVDTYRQNKEWFAPWTRQAADWLGMGGEADRTSMGPIAIQIRRSAEVLGYDPQNLTGTQRAEIERATQNPGTNIYIAAEYLAQLKAESPFALVPAEQMTPEQYRELAARYNGGPQWQSADAQAYGGRFARTLDEARQALNGP
ncbi:hypothetical protein [Streptomyces sp. NPDC048057]|uniref:hypothetical protein n=1 Tax=Streptomyces sp. NPDC048057 TaxID=3155628 RepID=UPI00340DAC95